MDRSQKPGIFHKDVKAELQVNKISIIFDYI